MVLFAQEVLLLDATGFGLLASAGAVGGVVGSFTASAVSKALGPGRSLAIAMTVFTATFFVIGLDRHRRLWYGPCLRSRRSRLSLWNVITVSLRQAIIPDRLLGRVNSVYRFFGWGMMPIGIFLGGLLVEIVTGLAEPRPRVAGPVSGRRVPHIGIDGFRHPSSHDRQDRSRPRRGGRQTDQASTA